MKTLGFLFVGSLALLALTACENDENEIEPETGYDEAYYAANASLSSSSANFTPSEGGGTVAFTAEGGTVVLEVDCGTDWAASAEGDWFDVEVHEYYGTVVVTAGENPEASGLTGTLTFSTAESGIQFASVAVTQNGCAPFLSLSVDTVELDSSAQSVTVGVECNYGWSVSPDPSCSWLSCSATDTILTLDVEVNGGGEPRECVLTLTATDGNGNYAEASLTVIQDRGIYIYVSRESIMLSPASDSGSVEVESNFGWSVSYDPSCSWLSCSATDTALTVEAVANTDEDSRECVLTLTAADDGGNEAEASLTVMQMGGAEGALIFVLTVEDTDEDAVLPLAGTVDCTVDWGDGSTETVSEFWPTHTYYDEGEYEVKVVGKVTALSSSDEYDDYMLTGVKQWGYTGLKSMESAFGNHWMLSEIPTDIHGSFSEVTSFAYAFPQEELSSIPDGLFDYCTKATNFTHVFSGTAIKSIPAGLFDNCPEAEKFSEAFYYCDQLTAIPDHLFDNCPEATSFEWTFYLCKALTYVPTDLFDNNMKAVNFNQTFRQCSKLTGESPYTEVNGVKIHLYERTDHVAELNCETPTNFNRCFYDCTGLDDYADIPEDWK